MFKPRSSTCSRRVHEHECHPVCSSPTDRITRTQNGANTSRLACCWQPFADYSSPTTTVSPIETRRTRRSRVSNIRGSTCFLFPSCRSSRVSMCCPRSLARSFVRCSFLERLSDDSRFTHSRFFKLSVYVRQPALHTLSVAFLVACLAFAASRERTYPYVHRRFWQRRDERDTKTRS